MQPSPRNRRPERPRPRAGFAPCATTSAPVSRRSRWRRPRPMAPGPPGRFERKPWTRAGWRRRRDVDARRAGCSRRPGSTSRWSTGTFSPDFARQMPGTEEGAAFWAAGISLIVHPRNPNVPAVHMNTRMVATGENLVRRRRRPDAGARPAADAGGSRQRRFPRRDAGGLRAASADRLRRATRPGATSTSTCPTARSRAASAASSTTISIRATGTPISPSPRTSGERSRRSTRRSCGGTLRRPGPRRTARSSWSAAGAMSSSTCSTIAARRSG